MQLQWYALCTMHQEDPVQSVQVPGGIQRLTHKHQRKKQEDFLDSLEPFK